MNNNNAIVATEKGNQEQLLTVNVVELTDTDPKKYCGVDIVVETDSDEDIWCLERTGKRGSNPIPKRFSKKLPYVFRGERARITFYNEGAFIRIWIRRDCEGNLSYSVHKGTYLTLYIWHRGRLGRRHGREFADFGEKYAVM